MMINGLLTPTWEYVCVAAVGIALALSLMSCGSETRTQIHVQKRIVTVSRTIQQVLAPDGMTVVKLESVTRTVTDENGEQIGNEEVTVKPPEIVGSLSKFVGAAAGLAGGPVVQQVAEKATDWLTTLITGGSLAATTAGTGYVAMRRKTAVDEARRRAAELEQQRDELIDGIERSKSRLKTIVDDRGVSAWEHGKVALEAEQSRGTKAAVKSRTA